ncbi:SpoIIE family protein phosphatase [Streptomyces sp. NBC_01724]|uniref:ATP-binding SpoIIE family protein phosphatase n=1 Tax=Streptomyces sp. NBC_01724 TaxID=2975922 RepID=UPI002E311827|nr:SpoIIE family protein phosphatase [Streptomyces sp. NBC_01724]
MTTAEELAEVAAPALADIAAVEVLDDVLAGEAPPPGPVSSEALLRRPGFRAAAGLDATPAYSPGEVIPGYPPSFTACLADLQPRLIRELQVDHEWIVHDPRRAELLRRAGAHSTMVVPLTARGVVLGLASFYRTQTPDPFEEDDLALAVEIGARAAVCLDNARQYTRERNAALTLQRSLLPQTVPVQNAVEVAWRHESTRGSGDWFDVIPLSGARVALVVGHLVGHGMQTAADMGRLRTAINTLAAQDPTPDELLAQLHDLASGPTGEHAHLADDDRADAHLAGVTCVYAVYDPISRRCTFARAGHPAPVIVHPNGSVEVPVGPPLGSDHPPYETTEVELPVGSTIALSTSSLVPSDHPPEGAARLWRILGNPHRSLKDTCDAIVREHQGRGEESTVLLLARTRSLGADQVSTWTLPNDPALVTTARTLAVRQLAHWDLQELEFTTELIVSELVTNAIRYATGPIQLRLIHDLTLICEVTDDSSTAPAPRVRNRRGRPRPLPHRPTHPPLGHPLHRPRQDHLGRTGPPIGTVNRSGVTPDQGTMLCYTSGRPIGFPLSLALAQAPVVGCDTHVAVRVRPQTGPIKVRRLVQPQSEDPEGADPHLPRSSTAHYDCRTAASPPATLSN